MQFKLLSKILIKAFFSELTVYFKRCTLCTPYMNNYLMLLSLPVYFLYNKIYVNFNLFFESNLFCYTFSWSISFFIIGLEYPAVVEFAPFQRIPKQRPGRKKDPKAGTLESDPTYISFLEKLQVQIQENTTAAANIKQHFFETNGNKKLTKLNTINY